jgi:ankyrin repeat protein
MYNYERKLIQLIEDGADISFESHAALRFAAQEGHINIVQFLIEKGADVHTKDERALRYAIANNHPKVARLLIEHKADIAYAKKAAVKCMFHPDKVIQFLEQEEEKLKEETININVQLRKEAYEGNLEKVKQLQLIEDGADISFESHAALRFAAQEGHINIVQFLIEKGADIHEWNNYALQEAVRNGHLEVIQLLIENGADIHASEEWVLRFAASHKHSEVARFLIETIPDRKGRRYC